MLVLNKVDRLILEQGLDAQAIAQRFAVVIEGVNAILRSHAPGSRELSLEVPSIPLCFPMFFLCVHLFL